MQGYGPSSYGDGIADIYDQWYGDRPETAAAVDALTTLSARGANGRALELGIGSGRLALPLRANGVDVWGIDASQSMVDLLHAKEGGRDVPVAIGDMAEIDLTSIPGGDTARFGLVFVAINTFFNLTTADAQARCLSRVRDLLDDDGVFVMEAFVPGVDRPTNMVEARTVALDHVILTATRHDPHEQTVTCQYIELRESGIKLRPLVVRYALVAELDRMAAGAGLRLVDRWSDWTGSAFTADATVHVSVFGAA